MAARLGAEYTDSHFFADLLPSSKGNALGMGGGGGVGDEDSVSRVSFEDSVSTFEPSSQSKQ